MKRIVIGGGSGFIGTALRADLRDRYDVVNVGRGRENVSWERLADVVDGADAVINLAGSSVQAPFSPGNRREILTSRVQSCAKVAEAIRHAKNPPAIWINASATGYYGDRGDEVLSESSAPGTGFLAETCVAWEHASLGNPLPKTIQSCLRFGVVLGNGGGAFPKLAQLTRMFLGSALGRGDQYFPWVHLADAIGVINFQLENRIPGPINVVALRPERNRDVMAELRRQLHRPWVPNVPAPILYAVGKSVGPDPETILSSALVLPGVLLEHAFEFRFPGLPEAVHDLLAS